MNCFWREVLFLSIHYRRRLEWFMFRLGTDVGCRSIFPKRQVFQIYCLLCGSTQVFASHLIFRKLCLATLSHWLPNLSFERGSNELYLHILIFISPSPKPATNTDLILVTTTFLFMQGCSVFLEIRITSSLSLSMLPAVLFQYVAFFSY